MIEKISALSTLNTHKLKKNEAQNRNYDNAVITSNNLAIPSGKLLHSYYVSNPVAFKGLENKTDKLKFVRDAMTDKSADIYRDAQKLAKKYQHDTVQPIHVLRVYMDIFRETKNQLENGTITAIEDNFFDTPVTLE